MAGLAFVLGATAPALVVGVAAGRAWRRGSVGLAVLLGLGVPLVVWLGFVVALRGGEGMAELAIVGWLASTLCAAIAAGLTVVRRTPEA